MTGGRQGARDRVARIPPSPFFLTSARHRLLESHGRELRRLAAARPTPGSTRTKPTPTAGRILEPGSTTPINPLFWSYAMQLASSFRYGSPMLRSDSPLSDDQIRRVTPSIFADGKHQSRSDRYTYIPTVDVLRGLRHEGFQPFMVCI